MKNTYFITYWNRYGTVMHEFIKARSQEKAEKKFYKKHDKVQIIKISLN